MDEITARNALRTGAELIRRRPRLVLLWAAVLLAQALVFAAATRELLAFIRAGFYSGRPVVSFNGQLLALSLAESLAALAVAAMLWTSAYRAFLRPADRRALAFGAEELCVLVAWLITQVVVVIVHGAALQFIIISRFASPVVGPMVYVVDSIDVLGLFWGAVASAWAFDRAQIAPFRCWTIARGRFWLLAGLVVGIAVLERLANAGVRQLVTGLRRAFPVSRVSPFEPFGVSAPRVQDLFQVSALLQDLLLAAVGALEIAFIAGVIASACRAAAPKPQAASFSSAVTGPAS